MTGLNIIIKLFVVFFVIVTSVIRPCLTEISDRRLCFDPKCSEPVAMGITLMNYNSNDPDIMSFASNVEVKIYSKEAGKRKDLWGVEINHVRGYAPKEFIREKKVLKKKLIHEVPTELLASVNKRTDVPKTAEQIEDAPKPSDDRVEQERDTVKPNQISPSFEVHDGTTIPVAVDEEPLQPSYATSTPQDSLEVEEHPRLSVYPNIASTETLKNFKNDDAIDIDPVDTSSRMEGYSGDSTINNEKSSEKKEETLSNESDLVDASKPKEFSMGTESNVDQEKISSTDESSQNVISSSQEIPIQSVISDDDSTKNVTNDSSQETLKTDENVEANVDDKKEKPESVEPFTGQLSDPQSTVEPVTSAEEKTIEPPIVDVDKEKSTETSVEPTLEIEKEKNLDVALPTEESKPEYAKVSETLEVQENSTIVEKIGEIETNSTEENEKVAVLQETRETIESQVDALENERKSDNEQNNHLEKSTDTSTDNEDSSEKSSEEKATENVPSHLNIMSPLFNRLSMIPSMMKDVVNAFPSNTEPEVSDDKNVDEKATEAIKPSDEINPEKIELQAESKLDKNTEDSNKIVDTESNSGKLETGEKSGEDKFVHTENNNVDNLQIEKKMNESTADSTEESHDFITKNPVQPGIYEKDETTVFVQEKVATDETSNFNGFPANRNLLNVGSTFQPGDHKSAVDSSKITESENSVESTDVKSQSETSDGSSTVESLPEISSTSNTDKDSCHLEGSCQEPLGHEEKNNFVQEADGAPEEKVDFDIISFGRNYWETLSYVVITAFTTLLFSLGYYYIENTRRDSQYIAKINELEKELLVCSKECTVLDDTLKSTKNKLDSIEDESFGSNEMVASLKAELEAAQTVRSELEDQVAMLEKELENATEAGFELERMLRETLSSNEDNPLAQSIEDLQTRLNAQQAANEALTNALNLKGQENETLVAELKSVTQKSEQLEVEVTRLNEELKHQNNLKNNLEQTLLEKVEHLEKQVKELSAERINLRKQLKGKEMELKDVLEVVNQMNTKNLDFEKLYNVSKIKAEANQLMEERDELKARLSEVEGAHQLLEEHVKLVDEEVSSLSEQCKLAEKAKRDAETRVEVLSNFFKEKEAQRQKEEAVWLQKQGEVSSTVERLHAMQNEIQNYKQQIEMLKREILDQEREYKNQISALETKSHENWVMARQNERRLEESKAEAGQLRNRLTLIEKNLNDADPEAKLHRLETNGETATSPQLFIGAEASSSPIMFTGTSGIPLPPPPSYLYGPPVPPFMPPPPPPPHSTSGIASYEVVGQRPPPLGGRLSSPPPPPLLHSVNTGGRYDDSRSPPPNLVSAPAIPPYRSFPPPLHHPPPLPGHIPPPLSNSSSHTWDDEPPSSIRNSGFHHHQQQHHHHHYHRDNQQRARNHKGSLHSSGESLDKNL